MLHLAQASVGAGSLVADACRQQPQRFGAFQQRNIAGVGQQFGVRARIGQHQKLHDKFGVHHPACAVLDVEPVGLDDFGAGHAFAHGDDLDTQLGDVTLSGQHGGAHRVKALVKIGVAQHAARPGDGLVFPGPGGVGAALLLVVGVRRKTGNQ